MLYLRWLETSKRFADRTAVFDGGNEVSFGQLAALAEAAPHADGPVIARTGGIPFFVEILRAWRDGQAVIPVEKDAPGPVLSRAPEPQIRLVKHTPGAAGIPRGIFFAAPQIIADAERLIGTMNLTPEVPNFAVVSLSHSYGFSSIVLPMLLGGVPLRLVEFPFPRVVEEALSHHASVTVAAVPSMWRAWHRSGILRNAPIRLAVSAGAPLALSLEHDVFEQSGLKIHNFYGASECGGIAWDDSETPRTSANILGRALPGVSVDVGNDGRFIVRSDAVAIGYDSPRGDDVLGEGIYQTRDRGFISANGELHLTETTGSAINASGRKISPAKVEAALLSTGLVRAVKVYGLPSKDPERNEEIAAKIELMDGISLETLKTNAMDKLQPWEMPRHWSVAL
jgi:long-chain acyl-CoA synthetase